MVDWRPMTLGDAIDAASAGHGEMFGMSQDEVIETISKQTEHSLECRTYYVGDDALCIMGIMAPGLIAERCHIWMISLPGLDRHKIAFARQAARICDELPYSSIQCLCDPGFAKTCRWLSRLGFAIVGEVEIAGRPFHQLERTA